MAIGVRVSILDSRDAMLSDSLVIIDKLYYNLRINTTLPIQLIDVHYAAVDEFDLYNYFWRIVNQFSKIMRHYLNRF